MALTAHLFQTFARPQLQVALTMSIIIVLIAVAFYSFAVRGKGLSVAQVLYDYGCFFWSCFLKPHSGDSTRNQQDALESFYKMQASIYDSTRMRLLRGREDMLGLVAAQVKSRAEAGSFEARPVWVDVGDP